MRAKVARIKTAALHFLLVSVASCYHVSLRSLGTDVMFAFVTWGECDYSEANICCFPYHPPNHLSQFFFGKSFGIFFCRVDDVISSLYFYANQSNFVSCRFETTLTTIRQWVIGSDKLLLLLFYFFLHVASSSYGLCPLARDPTRR